MQISQNSIKDINLAVGIQDLKKQSENVSDLSYSEIFKSVQLNNIEDYKKHLIEKFGIRLTIKNVAKDQKTLDKIGTGMCGNDVIIAPNILDEMVNNTEKAAYYESKIQNFFDSISKWKKQSAAMGLTFEPCGVVIHEDGTVTYICGGEDSPERKAKVKYINELKQKKKRERMILIEQLMLKHDCMLDILNQSAFRV